MIGNIAVIAISAALFVYWFRYTCILILTAKTSHDYAREVAAANNLQFVEIERTMRAFRERAQLDRLERSLQRDYEIVLALLRHSSDALPVEDRILKLDYRLLRLAYKLFPTRYGINAMNEMCQIIGYFANTMGERTTCTAGA